MSSSVLFLRRNTMLSSSSQTSTQVAISSPKKEALPSLKRLKSKFTKRKRHQEPAESVQAAEVEEPSTSTEPEPGMPCTSTSASPSLTPDMRQEISVKDIDNNSNEPEEVPSPHPLPDMTLVQRLQSRLLDFPSSCVPSILPMNLPPNTTIPETLGFSSLLSSTSTMSNSLAKGRDSVLAMLERIVSSSSKGKEKATGTVDSIKEESDSDSDVEVSSVMISSPLQPADETEVEIARSEVVSINLDGDKDESIHDTSMSSENPGAGSTSGTWPFTSSNIKKKKPNTKEIRVWYPSRTKVSLQACWWGYRIYLPPPVMRILSDKSLEAAKRAAMITAALTWLVSHIPAATLPIQVRPLVTIAKQIVPLFSYVGGFIAWSWTTVQGFDKGDGVILSATWLLPMALIPGTWFFVESPWEIPSPTVPPTPPPKDLTDPIVRSLETTSSSDSTATSLPRRHTD